MNYRHLYHAGNFADIIKHLCLINILNSLNCKEKPYFVLDAFAGVGIYNLTAEQSLITGEALQGIVKLFNYLKHNNLEIPNLLEQYFKIISSYNNSNIDCYPGSPSIIADLMRSCDRLIACELHHEDFIKLKNNFTDNKQVITINMDAYKSVNAYLPPTEKRGLVMFDPPFEKKDELDKLFIACSTIYKRFYAAIIMIWVPIKDQSNIKLFEQKIFDIGFKEYVCIRFDFNPIAKQINNKLSATSIFILNPPWQFKHNMDLALQFISNNVFLGSISKVTFHKQV